MTDIASSRVVICQMEVSHECLHKLLLEHQKELGGSIAEGEKESWMSSWDDDWVAVADRETWRWIVEDLCATWCAKARCRCKPAAFMYFYVPRNQSGGDP